MKLVDLAHPWNMQRLPGFHASSTHPLEITLVGARLLIAI